MLGRDANGPRLDLEQRALVGNPVTVADPVGSTAALAQWPYRCRRPGWWHRAGGARQRQLTWFDRSGKPLGVVGDPDENNLLAPHLSPDGHRVATSRTVQGNVDIWLLDADRTTPFTFDAALDRFPVWSPDGGRIVFDSTRRGIRDLYQASSPSPGSETLPRVGAERAGFVSGWPLVSYLRIDSQTAGDLWILPLRGGPETVRVFG